MKMKKYLFGMLLSVLMVVSANNAQAALKNLGDTCSKGTECVSGFCGESSTGLVCAGGVAEGGACSITDQAQACGIGLYCNGDTFVCERDTRQGNTGSFGTDSQSDTGQDPLTAQPRANCGPTEVCNPLAFKSVESFLQFFLSAMQRIIVVIALIMIVIGALMYITSGGGDQIKKAKSTITAALIGLAIAIAAPSFLKEISILLGWTPNSAAVAQAKTLTQISMNVLNFLLAILGILALIMMVLAGVMYTTAAVDSKQAESAKNMAKYAIIGVLVAMSSMVLLQQVAKFFVQ